MVVRVLGCRLACWAALLVVAPAAVAHAQGSLSVAGLASIQGAGKSDCPYLCGPFGGTAAGIAVAGRASLTPRVDVGLEVSFARAIHGQQQVRVPGGSLDLLAAHRDTTTTGILRWHPPANRTLNVAAVAGAGIAIRHTTRGGIFRSDSANGANTPAVHVVADDTVPEAVGGVDAMIRILPRVLVVPTFRLHYLFDEDRQADGVVKRGVGSVIARTGVGIEIVF